jgi:hypothetical protein
MKKKMFLFMLIVIVLTMPVMAGTVAYWRFEDGTAGTNIVHTAANGVFSPDIQDVSGNGNHLSAWTSEDFAGYRYRDVVAYSRVPQTGAANTLSVKNTGGVPGMFTQTGSYISTMTPAQFTVEVTFKIENGGYRTIIGRDSYGTADYGIDTNQALAAFYLQAIPNNGLAVKYCDVAGYWHDAISANNIFQSFDFPSNNDGVGVPWYSLAAVSDGLWLKLYLYNHDHPENGYVLIAQDDLLYGDNPGSTNTALTAGAGDGGDWDAGNWSVGRGLYNGGHTDRAWGYIDEVRISDSALTVTEFLMGPLPYDPVVDQTPDMVHGDVDVVLNWNAPGDPNRAVTGNQVHPDIVNQCLFMTTGSQTDPNLYYIGATGVDPGTSNPASSFAVNVAFDRTYRWSVVAIMEGHEQTFTVGVSTPADVDPNNIIGPYWSFDSLASIPVITAQPQGVLTDAGGPAVFHVTVSSISPAHYAWYRSPDKANDTPANDTAVGTDSATLTLTGAGVVEGFYYCVITNDSETQVVSNTAFLEIKRLMAWYKFENDIADSANNYDGTAIKADPNLPFAYVSGKVNQAISLNGIDEAVQIPRTIQNSMTLELWVKTTDTAGVGNGWFDGDGLIDGEVAGYEHNDFGTTLRGNVFSFGVGNSTGSQLTVNSTTAINDGQWHYCVATRDHVTGQIRVYVDGALEASGTAPLGTKDEPAVLRIGSLQTNTHFLTCQVDEVKIYNYPLTDLQVAMNYNAITGESVCVASERPNAKYDLNGDCIVNLEDFAEAAGAWLDCGLYPDCL